MRRIYRQVHQVFNRCTHVHVGIHFMTELAYLAGVASSPPDGGAAG